MLHPSSGRRRPRLPALALAAAFACVPFSGAIAQAPAAAGAGAAAQRFDIPAGPLAPALTRFADQAGLRLLAPAELLRERTTRGVHASLPPEQALAQLLEGTGLVHRFTAPGLVTVAEAAPSSSLPSVASAPQGLMLPSTTVTAARDRKERAYETPAAVSVITREEMDRTAPRHVSEILQATPGVFTTTNEQVPSVNVDIRGLKDFGRVNMSIDGMRQNYQRSGHGQRNGEMFIDAELISGVEIEKGATSSLGSLGTVAGVADFQTIEPEDVLLPGRSTGWRLRGTTGVGSLGNGNKFAGSAAFAARARDDLDVLVAVAGRRAGAYEPGRRGKAFNLNARFYSDLPVNVVSQTQQDQDSLLLKARWRPLAGHELKFTAMETRLDYAESASQNTIDYYNYGRSCDPVNLATRPPDHWVHAWCANPVTLGEISDNIYPRTSTSKSKTRSVGLDYAWQPAGTPWIDLRAKLYYVVTDSHTVNTRDTDTSFITRTDTLGMSVANRALVELSPDWLLDWRLGAEAFMDRNRPDTRSTQYSADMLEYLSGATPKGSRVMAGWFTRASFQYRDWLEITPGLRYDWYRLWGRTGFSTADFFDNGRLLLQYRDIEVDHRGGRFLPSLGLAIKPSAQVQFFANAGRGWRPPAITETLVSSTTPGHATPLNYYPNYLLEPEKTDSVDIGANLRWDGLLTRGDRLRVKASAFRSRTENYTFFTNSVGMPGGVVDVRKGMYVNSLDPVVFKGLELDANYDAGTWFLGLNATKLERESDFRRLYYPLGGYTGPANIDLTTTDTTFLLYNPRPPKYSGRLTGGVRLLDRKLELSATLRCASKGGRHSFINKSDGSELLEDAQNGFCVWDAQASYRPSPQWTVGLTLKNIRDREYAQAMGDAVVRSYAPGRTLTVFAEAKF